MSDLNAKMHLNRFLLGIRPKPRRGAYSDPQIVGLKGPTSKEREEEKREGERKGGEKEDQK